MKKNKGLLYKKFFAVLSLISFSFQLIFLKIQVAFGQSCGPDVGIICNPTAGTIDTVADAIIVVIQYLLGIIGIISLLFIVIAGIKYITSSGNEEKMASAKNSLYSSAYGLIVALSAYTILAVIDRILNS